MTIDFQSIIDILIVAALGTIGYFYRQIVQEQKELKRDVVDIRVDLPKSYVSKDDLSTHLVRIETMLNKIFDRLEMKADK
jgi:hypothetical protein